MGKEAKEIEPEEPDIWGHGLGTLKAEQEEKMETLSPKSRERLLQHRLRQEAREAEEARRRAEAMKKFEEKPIKISYDPWKAFEETSFEEKLRHFEEAEEYHRAKEKVREKMRKKEEREQQVLERLEAENEDITGVRRLFSKLERTTKSIRKLFE